MAQVDDDRFVKVELEIPARLFKAMKFDMLPGAVVSTLLTGILSRAIMDGKILNSMSKDYAEFTMSYARLAFSPFKKKKQEKEDVTKEELSKWWEKFKSNLEPN